MDITINLDDNNEVKVAYAVVDLPLEDALEAALEKHPDWTSAVIVITRKEWKVEDDILVD